MHGNWADRRPSDNEIRVIEEAVKIAAALLADRELDCSSSTFIFVVDKYEQIFLS